MKTLKRKIKLLVSIEFRVISVTNLAEEATVVRGGWKERLLVIATKDVIKTQVGRSREAPGHGPGEGKRVSAGESPESGKSSKNISEGGWLDNNDYRLGSLVAVPRVERRNKFNLRTVSQL